MNTMIALPIAAAVPTTTPAMPPSADPIFAAVDEFRQTDADLTAAFEPLQAEDVIDKLWVRQEAAYERVIHTRPTTPAGLSALTTWARERMDWLRKHGSSFEGDKLYELSAAIDDATRGMSGLETWSPPPAIAAATSSEALALVERCRKLDRRWSVLADEINSAEEAAMTVHGSRPIALIAWRNYSHIGGSEIERARDEFIRDGIDEKLVQSEYRAAKKRYKAALKAEDDWDRKAGLSDIRAEYENVRSESCVAWKALGKVRLMSVCDAAAIIGILRERVRKFDELSDDWEVAAFLHVSRFFAQVAV